MNAVFVFTELAYTKKKIIIKTLNDGTQKRFTRYPWPRWRADPKQLDKVENLSQELRFSSLSGSKLKRIFSHRSHMKMHDWNLLASDAGVYILLLLELGKTETMVLCRLIRVFEALSFKKWTMQDLRLKFTFCVQTLTMAEIYLPIYLARM